MHPDILYHIIPVCIYAAYAAEESADLDLQAPFYWNIKDYEKEKK